MTASSDYDDLLTRDVDAVLDQVPTFVRQQGERCAAIGIDVAGLPISHVAIRMRTWRHYVALRDALERVSVGNLENVWNGRPISKLALRDPIPVGDVAVPLIELLPPFHQRVYRMGLEHVGFVVGDDHERFGVRHRAVLTGQQFQSEVCEPFYVLFAADYTHVKFYRWSLGDVCVREGASFDVVTHADWHPADPDAGPYEIS